MFRCRIPAKVRANISRAVAGAVVRDSPGNLTVLRGAKDPAQLMEHAAVKPFSSKSVSLEASREKLATIERRYTTPARTPLALQRSTKRASFEALALAMGVRPAAVEDAAAFLDNDVQHVLPGQGATILFTGLRMSAPIGPRVKSPMHHIDVENRCRVAPLRLRHASRPLSK